MTVNFQLEPIREKSNNKTPYIVAGPCSVESFEQLNTVVEDLKAIPEVQAIRCGIWKPRTRPGGFEGVREKGLEWIQEIKKKNPVKFCVEVATTKHIEACLKAGIDMIWIGARSSGNPFSIQELANALKGVDIPVMIKNPMNPDIKLWVGAFERFYASGSRQLIAIHRGFHIFASSMYRNDPCWEIPIELKRIAPDLPLLCDPSHIGGSVPLLKPISQTAMDLDFDGLMIEVHPNPKEALTDADQQITPTQLKDILSELVIRTSTDNNAKESDLYTFRSYIDTLDKELIRILNQRMEVSKEMIQYKKEHNMTVFQLKRWSQMLEDRLHVAQETGLDTEFVKKIMEQIHAESIRLQNQILNSERK